MTIIILYDIVNTDNTDNTINTYKNVIISGVKMAVEKLSVCESLAAEIRRDIEIGIIRDGEKLPSCREMAMNKGINPNTVQKAYTLLENQGYIRIVPQKGAYANKSPLTPSDGNSLALAEKSVTAIRSSGMTKNKLIEIINKIYGESND